MYSREIDWDALRNETRFHRFLKISRTYFGRYSSSFRPPAACFC